MTDELQLMKNQLKNVSEKLDTLEAPKEEMKDEGCLKITCFKNK